MAEDIIHFQPSVTLEYLLDQTLGCIIAWHSDVMKRYAEYNTSSDPMQPGRNPNIYKAGMIDPGGGKWQSISFAAISAMSPREGALLQQNIKGMTNG